MDRTQVHEPLLRALETESGGIKICTTAIRDAQYEDFRKEWEYLDETRTPEQDRRTTT